MTMMCLITTLGQHLALSFISNT